MPQIKKDQTLADFTTQQAGTMDALFEVAIANGISITDTIEAGTELAVEPVKTSVTSVFANSVLDIITIEEAVRPGRRGIGYMQIGTSFIVS